MHVDEKRFEALIEESQDLHTDAMKTAYTAIGDLEAISHDTRVETMAADAEGAATIEDSRSGVSVGKIGALAAAGVAGAAFANMFASASAGAATGNVNVQACQTSASLENLAVSTYGKALTLPYIINGNAVVKAFAQKTMAQHAQHAVAFNAAAQKLGGQPQNGLNPHFAPVVAAMVPKLAAADATTGPGMVVTLAIQLEMAASQTYSKNCQLMDDLPSRTVMSSILGIDSQHLAVLLAVQALLPTPALIAIPTNAAQLPAAAGSVGFPDTFYPNDPAFARPPAEGAL